MLEALVVQLASSAYLNLNCTKTKACEIADFAVFMQFSKPAVNQASVEVAWSIFYFYFKWAKVSLPGGVNTLLA